MIAQQDREYAALLKQDQMRTKQNAAATTIQRVTRRALARKMQKQAADDARARVELEQRVVSLREAIENNTAGAIEADADMLNALTPAERKTYMRLRNAYTMS